MRITFITYIFLLTSFLLAACADEHDEILDDDTPLTIAVTSAWLDGRAEGGTRALPHYLTLPTFSSPDPDWVYIDLPATLGGSFYVKKTLAQGSDVSGFTPYHEFYRAGVKLDKCPITRNLAGTTDITAYYQLDNGTAPDPVSYKPFKATDIPVIGPTDFLSSEVVRYTAETTPRDHLLFTLIHRTALLRLKFGVNSQYLKTRDIVLRNVTINDQSFYLGNDDNVGGTPGKQLTADPEAYALAYVRTTGAGGLKANTQLTFKCTYDVYDKDLISADHLTRKGVTATNTVTLSTLSGSTITELQAGYYYDLTITINPDYLYVLSEHDNKQHLKIQ